MCTYNVSYLILRRLTFISSFIPYNNPVKRTQFSLKVSNLRPHISKQLAHGDTFQKISDYYLNAGDLNSSNTMFFHFNFHSSCIMPKIMNFQYQKVPRDIDMISTLFQSLCTQSIQQNTWTTLCLLGNEKYCQKNFVTEPPSGETFPSF